MITYDDESKKPLPWLESDVDGGIQAGHDRQGEEVVARAGDGRVHFPILKTVNMGQVLLSIF